VRWCLLDNSIGTHNKGGTQKEINSPSMHLPILGNNNSTDDTTGATIAGHGMGDAFLHHGLGLILGHALAKLVVNETVDVC